MKSRILVLAAAGIAASTLAAFAHGGATGIVKERMEAMETMGKVVKSLSAMMRGETKYDAGKIREGAAAIKSHAGSSLTDLFPEGSLPKASEAKSEIWTDWEEFSTLAKQLGVLADGLERAADNGLMMGAGTAGQGSMMGTQGMMGAGGMMGSPGMMGTAGHPMLDPDQLAGMPADGVFNMVVQTCSACHSKFRVDKK